MAGLFLLFVSQRNPIEASWSKRRHWAFHSSPPLVFSLDLFFPFNAQLLWRHNQTSAPAEVTYNRNAWSISNPPLSSFAFVAAFLFSAIFPWVSKLIPSFFSVPCFFLNLFFLSFSHTHSTSYKSYLASKFNSSSLKAKKKKKKTNE